MAPNQYSAFIIANRVGAFFAVLNLGVQIATTKRISIGLANGRRAELAEVLGHATYRTRNAALAGFLIVPIPTFFIQKIFPQLPADVVQATRLGVAIFVASSLIALLLTPYYSLLVAAHMLGRAVIFQVIIRIISGIALVVLAKAGVGVGGMAAMTSVGTLGVALAIRAAARQLFPDIRTPLFGRRSTTVSLGSDGASLAAIELAQFVILQIDVIIVGRFQYTSVVPYYVCVSLVTAIEAVHNAITQAMVPEIAARYATQGAEGIASLVIRNTKIVAMYWLAAAMSLVLVSPILLRIWVGDVVGGEAVLPLKLLIVGYLVRYSEWSFSATVLALGQVRRIIETPFVLASAHFLLVIALGGRYGSNGVASATVIGGALVLVWTCAVNVKRCRDIFPISAVRYFKLSLFRPLALIGAALAADAVLPTLGVVGVALRFASAAVGLLAIAVIIDVRDLISIGRHAS